MNKYMMMITAALLGSASPTAANNQYKSHTIHFYSSNGGSYCDGMSFHKTGGHMVAGMHLNEDCAGGANQVAGTVNKRSYDLFESFSSEIIEYEIDKPIRNGGSWEAYVCFSGTTCIETNAGLYKLGFPAHRPQNARSTVTRTREIITQHKASRVDTRR